MVGCYYKFSMYKFAKGNKSKNCRGLSITKKMTSFLIFTRCPIHYPLAAVQVCSKLLAVRVFEISSILCSSLQRAIAEFLLIFTR